MSRCSSRIAESTQKRKTIDVRHPEVDDDGVRAAGLDGAPALGGTDRRAYAIAFNLQNRAYVSSVTASSSTIRTDVAGECAIMTSHVAIVSAILRADN
jgi:hypothetical protein